MKNRQPFAFAGLWEVWTGPGADAAPYRSCTIITTAASESVLPIHHRMPAIIKPEKYDHWLDPGCSAPAELKDIIHHWTETELVNTPVSPRVNSARHNHPGNIKPMTQTSFDF